MRTEYEHLLGELTTAQGFRHLRQDIDPETGEVGWILHERNVMHDTVNVLRGRRGLGPAKREDIERAERMASGHIDYTTKFALYCAEIADPPAPDPRGSGRQA